MNLNMPNLLALARARGEPNPKARHWTDPLPYEF